MLSMQFGEGMRVSARLTALGHLTTHGQGNITGPLRTNLLRALQRGPDRNRSEFSQTDQLSVLESTPFRFPGCKYGHGILRARRLKY
jgi:hypothetical protein